MLVAFLRKFTERECRCAQSEMGVPVSSLRGRRAETEWRQWGVFLLRELWLRVGPPDVNGSSWKRFGKAECRKLRGGQCSFRMEGHTQATVKKLQQWFSTRGGFATGDLWQDVETFSVIMTGLWGGDGGLCSCHSGRQDQGCCWTVTQHRTAPTTETYLAHDGRSAVV